MAYIQCLLRNQGRELHVFELRQGKAEAGTGDEISTSELSTRRPEDAGEVVDRTARTEFKRRLQEIGQERALAEAANDREKLEHLDEEAEQIGEQLRASTDKTGRSRRLGDPAEKVRKTVTVAIDRSIDKLRKPLPELATHLDSFLKKGSCCSYLVETVSWDL